MLRQQARADWTGQCQVTGTQSPSKGRGTLAVAGLKHLRELDLCYTDLTDEGIAALARLVQLERLRLPKETTDEQLARLAPLVHLKELKIGNGIDFPKIRGPGLAAFVGMKEMKDLDLSTTEVDDAGLAYIAGMTQLETLRLPKRITDAGLAQIKGLHNLVELDLRGCAVTDAGLVHIKDLRNLTSLDLGECDVTDAGVANLGQLKKLRRLFLDDTKITDASLPTLESLTALRDLWVNSTGLTDEGAKRLETALPETQILHYH